MAAPSINGTKKAKAKAAAGGAKMHKARTGSRLISGGDWLRIGYRAGVKRQSSAVRLAMRIKAEQELRAVVKCICALVRAGRHKMVSVEDLRLVCKLQGRPLLVGSPVEARRRREQPSQGQQGSAETE
jgi:hypothetical protein